MSKQIYHTRNKKNEWVQVEGYTVSVPGNPKIKLFRHKTGWGHWAISEERTGAAIEIGKSGESLKDVRKRALDRIAKMGSDKFLQAVEDFLARNPKVVVYAGDNANTND